MTLFVPHVEYTIFIFSLSALYVMCLFLVKNDTFYAGILATAWLVQELDINIFLIKRHEGASISLIIKILGFSPVWTKSNLVICGHGFDVFW